MTAGVEELPLVSVVIETVTARYDMSGASMLDDLGGALTGLERQTYPQERIETVVVVDPGVAPALRDEVRRRFPSVKLAESRATNYCAAKNAGADAASGSVVAMLDGDCEPVEEWLAQLVSRLEPGVAAVAGKTRYASSSRQSRTLSLHGFGFVMDQPSGEASGLLLNNVALRSEVFRRHPLDARVRRNGGCLMLYHELRAAGETVVFEPAAEVVHGVGDIRGSEWVRKHFGRGYDGVALYRLDSRGLLRGTRLFRRYGIAALVAIMARRVLLDWRRIVTSREQLGIPAPAVPYYAAVSVGIRSIEFCGMVAAVLDPERYTRRATPDPA